MEIETPRAGDVAGGPRRRVRAAAPPGGSLGSGSWEPRDDLFSKRDRPGLDGDPRNDFVTCRDHGARTPRRKRCVGPCSRSDPGALGGRSERRGDPEWSRSSWLATRSSRRWSRRCVTRTVGSEVSSDRARPVPEPVAPGAMGGKLAEVDAKLNERGRGQQGPREGQAPPGRRRSPRSMLALREGRRPRACDA